ncbi:hypothetical protein A2115_00605 [Candidatus Woesebacteria bacterium GWA1_41_8]|jgi:hypothetical protein|uniref:LTD domain-containing protein n=1 Tax=Candidatus Woesebacteria bacterium GWA1_41_8 TaxID=1802471 RepID=A0A1F7WG85_9BACT|nr:MAG: hypothetical protein A2115_00605 [Candidatus Woesebacteria bacterium GWA1_41_8]
MLLFKLIKKHWSQFLSLLVFVITLHFFVSPTYIFSATSSVVINEVAWSGTTASDSDEWIELYNPTASAIDITGWTLTATDGAPAITLSGTVPAEGYFLLERSDDNTIKDIAADQIYTGALGNGGESLELKNASSVVVDTVNTDGDVWSAGTSSPVQSMERVDPLADDSDSNWATNDGVTINGTDAGDNVVLGTPKAANSAISSNPTPTEELTPTPTDEPTPTPTGEPSATLSVVVNEVAWGGTTFSADDEWIELYNTTSSSVDLTDWTLKATDGTPDITLAGSIPANGYFLLERGDDAISDVVADQIYSGALGNGGESLELRNSNSDLVDTANNDGGTWPAGDSGERKSMERVDPLLSDTDENWATNDGITINGKDSGDSAIMGTPKESNSTSGESPTPTPTEELTPTPTDEPIPTEAVTPTPTIEPSPVPQSFVIGYLGFGSRAKVCTLNFRVLHIGFFQVYVPKVTCQSLH